MVLDKEIHRVGIGYLTINSCSKFSGETKQSVGMEVRGRMGGSC